MEASDEKIGALDDVKDDLNEIAYENGKITELKDEENDLNEITYENGKITGLEDREDDENLLKFTYWDFLFGIGAILVFYFDLITDIILMTSYFNEGHFVYFGLTMTFVIFPLVLINTFSMIWYCSNDAIEAVSTVPPIIWRLRIIFHSLLMAPVWRAIESLHFGIKSLKSSNNERYYAYRADFIKTISLLKLLEAFVEAAPQLVLQLFILLTKAHVLHADIEADQVLNVTSANETMVLPFSEDFFQVLFGKIQNVAVFSAFLSLSLSQTIFARNIRTESDMGSFAFFSWRFYTVGARVLALSFFASAFPNLWFLLVVVIHWSVMSAMFIGVSLCRSGCLKMSFYLVFSLVYLFTYIKLNDNHSGRKYLFYYSFEVIEDAILVILWACLGDSIDTSTSLFWTLLVLHFGGVVLGLTSMFIYYSQFHPSGPKHDLCTECFSLVFLAFYNVPKQNGKNQMEETEMQIK